MTEDLTHEPNGNEDRDRAEYRNEIENNHAETQTEIENEIQTQNEDISLIKNESLIQSEIKKVTRTIIILITLNICPVYAGTDHTFAHGDESLMTWLVTPSDLGWQIFLFL